MRGCAQAWALGDYGREWGCRTVGREGIGRLLGQRSLTSWGNELQADLVNAPSQSYQTTMEREYVIDGHRTYSLEAFFDEFGRIVLHETRWGRNLDAFDDVLQGEFETPDEGFTLRWINSGDARNSLGYAETARQLRLRLERCHPTSREQVRQALSAAERGAGPTVFDWLVEIIMDHGPGGNKAVDNVRLVFE